MEKCEWKVVADGIGNHYKSECGGDWFFFNGTTKDNQMTVCPFCGKKIYEPIDTQQQIIILILGNEFHSVF